MTRQYTHSYNAKVHFNDSGGKKVPSLTLPLTSKSFVSQPDNSALVRDLHKMHGKTIRSHGREHGSSPKKYEFDKKIKKEETMYENIEPRKVTKEILESIYESKEEIALEELVQELDTLNYELDEGIMRKISRWWNRKSNEKAAQDKANKLYDVRINKYKKQVSQDIKGFEKEADEIRQAISDHKSGKKRMSSSELKDFKRKAKRLGRQSQLTQINTILNTLSSPRKEETMFNVVDRVGQPHLENVSFSEAHAYVEKRNSNRLSNKLIVVEVKK